MSEDFWQTSGAGMVPCGHLMAVMQRPTLLRRQTLLRCSRQIFGTISSVDDLCVVADHTAVSFQPMVHMCYEAPVTDVGSEFLAAQAATRQERKQTSTETPATTTQQFGGECV